MNPFRYSEPVPPEELLDRDAEAVALLERGRLAYRWRLGADWAEPFAPWTVVR